MNISNKLTNSCLVRLIAVPIRVISEVYAVKTRKYIYLDGYVLLYLLYSFSMFYYKFPLNTLLNAVVITFPALKGGGGGGRGGWWWLVPGIHFSLHKVCLVFILSCHATDGWISFNSVSNFITLPRKSMWLTLVGQNMPAQN